MRAWRALPVLLLAGCFDAVVGDLPSSSPSGPAPHEEMAPPATKDISPSPSLRGGEPSTDGGASAAPSSPTVPFSLVLQAEDASSQSGLQFEACSDLGGGTNAGWTDAGDWLEFTDVTVPKAGSYRLRYRVAALGAGGRISVAVDGVVLATTNVPLTGGWQSWVDVDTEVMLDAGGHRFRFEVVQPGFNLNHVTLTESQAEAPPSPSSPPPPSSLPNSGTNPDFGPNVYIYEPTSTDFGAVMARFAGLADATTGQFSNDRVAFLFKPGHYQLDIPVGYYTTVYGLGLSPDDVTVKGDVRSDAVLAGGNATCNFWRGVENFSVVPTVSGRMKWAVAQATPFRRMHVKGNLALAETGATPWASGGFIANSKVDGQVSSLAQQQWLTRNSELASWSGSNWNMAFVGVTGAPAENGWSKAQPFTVVPQAPKVVEKPFLYFAEGAWGVFVPTLKAQSLGFSWDVGSTSGVRLPLADFHVAKPGTDTAATLNAALAAGKHLLLTPGIYPLQQSLLVQRPGTVVLGLGFATLVPQGGVAAIRVSDVDGVRIAGVMVDAGTTSSPVLVEVGTPGSAVSHAANPTVLHDLVVRIGNGAPGHAEVAVTVHSNDVLADHLWLWVADHDAYTFPLYWKENRAKNGLVVNGANVTAYGLFVEHFQEYQTVWNGEGGRVYMYQSELPYEADATWSSAPGVHGYASYKVGAAVTQHQAWATGVYMVFGQGSSARAMEAPVHPNVQFYHLMTAGIVSGSLAHVINDTGGTAGPGGTAYVTRFP